MSQIQIDYETKQYESQLMFARNFIICSSCGRIMNDNLWGVKSCTNLDCDNGLHHIEFELVSLIPIERKIQIICGSTDLVYSGFHEKGHFGNRNVYEFCGTGVLTQLQDLDLDMVVSYILGMYCGKDYDHKSQTWFVRSLESRALLIKIIMARKASFWMSGGCMIKFNDKLKEFSGRRENE